MTSGTTLLAAVTATQASSISVTALRTCTPDNNTW